MENELKSAYKNNEFGIDYQPRIDLVDKGRVWLETFLFWKHPLIGKLSAAYFLKYAESTGLVILLDQYIIENSLKKIEELHKKGFDDVYIATNISLRHFQRKDFVEKICLILERGGKSSEHLMLQIAGELDIGKIETYKVMFDKIKQYGVKLSINNYCVNYEQLDLLNRLNIDEIKISSEYLVSNSIFNKNVLKDIVILSKDLGYKILVNKISDDDIFKEVVNFLYIHQFHHSTKGLYLYKFSF